MLTGIGVWLGLAVAREREPALLWGLACAMGLQNALVTRVSGAVVRTTHVTGIVTDVGIQLVQMFAWVREGAQGRGARGLLRALRELPTAVQFERTRLHLGLALAFLVGCTAGPLLFLRHGPVAFVLPCSVLLLLVVLDLWFSPAAGPRVQPA